MKKIIPLLIIACLGACKRPLTNHQLFWKYQDSTNKYMALQIDMQCFEIDAVIANKRDDYFYYDRMATMAGEEATRYQDSVDKYFQAFERDQAATYLQQRAFSHQKPK